MKSLLKFITESANYDNNLVTFVTCKSDKGIMFATEDSEMDPKLVENICKKVGINYNDENINNNDISVYFWNITKNEGGYVSKGDCDPIV